ncbi:MAG: GTPase HflX [Clostridia bacterium]|nr:GTPase HflX [Clostridia bacterium]
MIHGNTLGLRESVLREMEKLYDISFDRSFFLPDRLLGLLVGFTEQLNREIMVYLDRNGEILEVAVGSISQVGLTEMHLRRDLDRLTGFRCIHTHPGGNARLSEVDLQALRLLRFDAMCAVGVENGLCTGISAAFLGEVEYGRLSVRVLGPLKPGRVPQSQWLREIELSEEAVQAAIAQGGITEQAEKAMLISVDDNDSLDELAALTDTAGAVIVSRVLQRLSHPDHATYIGSGKAQELGLECQTLDVDLAIVDGELTASQQKNLEAALGVRVIDRTSLILDIFARRATTAEGKLQVELAQLKYRLPRLAGSSEGLSRLGGGIGTRGPGETRLETDRRHIRTRIDELTAQLGELKKQREMRRSRRAKNENVTVALVGYTNAGKSTLLNALSGSDVLVEDKLFATLDPVTRRISLPENRECDLVDTVGFINKLPHSLVEAFKSTLEEAVYADLLVVVSDVSSPFYLQQRRVVSQVLSELGASDKPVIEALNKCDLAPAGFEMGTGDTAAISALNGTGLGELKQLISDKIASLRHRVEILIPYSKGAVLSLIHKKGQVESEEYTDEGTKVVCLLDAVLYARVEKELRGAPDV